MQVMSTREWEKDRLAELVSEVIRQFSENGHDQINLSSPSSQKSLAVAVIEALEKKGHLS